MNKSQIWNINTLDFYFQMAQCQLNANLYHNDLCKCTTLQYKSSIFTLDMTWWLTRTLFYISTHCWGSQSTSEVTSNKPTAPQKSPVKLVESLWDLPRVQCGRWTDARSLLRRSTLTRLPQGEVTSHQTPMEPGLSGSSLALFQLVIPFTAIQ